MHSSLRVLVGSLAPGVLPTTRSDRLPDGTVLLDLGEDHPSRAGLLELRLWTQDGTVSTAEVVVGAMHRGAEKLFEVREYRQILMLADRHDWQAPFAGELCVALACEKMLGLEVPPRAVWLRTLLAEHGRILSHLGFLGYVGRTTRTPTGLPRLRERLRGQNRALTGNRVHPMANRLGGLAVDADDGWLAEELAVLDEVDREMRQLRLMVDSEEFTARSRGVARLQRDVIMAYGVSGPAARASGLELDLRRSEPYLAYPELAELITTARQDAGDAWARFVQLVEEVAASSRLVRAAAERLAGRPGPVDVKLPKIIKLPEGAGYLSTEAPLGTAGCYLVSRGEKTPWRLKLRTASFNNVAALEALLIGCRVTDLEMALASMGYVVGDIDK
ncbi:NADH-quinone oxidoreductase subunit D [Microlunatus panaciterrae]|uniref:NADH-quinone oxidoreductase subunit D n=1 Tax=Microlunatus panaciterrae TaxID=400768 RepID=A0ABS2RHD6_9ACTN|nr:NADH-quinone oxidoreductase subunit D [Microlunatus panaciterrae]MBM7798420.1 NADH-quinone oxidoreductase subunit D [Microlunatus panaciterrae]